MPLPPLLDSLQKRLAKFLLDRIPLSRRTILRTMTSDQVLGPGQVIDVAQVHSILDGSDIGNTNEYFALCDHMILSDSHMQGEIAKRKLALLGDQMVIGPADKKNSDDLAAAEACKEMVDGLPSFLTACASLLDGSLWPLAILEKVFRPAKRNPQLRFEVESLTRVPPRLFDFRTGYLRIWDTDLATGNIINTSQDPDPMRYIIHRGHLLSTPDYRGGPIRSLIFWWLFSNYDRDWWARFMDRYGAPFLIGKFDQADDDSRILLENAFSLASKLGGLVISRQTDVELKEAMSKSAGDGFEMFLKTCQREKSKLIVGQTTSADADAGRGLGGSSVSKVQANVRGDIRQFDALWLGSTIEHQLFLPFLRMNGLPGRAKISWGGEEADDVVQTTEAVANLSMAQIQVTDEGLATLSLRVGLPLQRAPMPATPPSLPPGRGMKALTATPVGRLQLADLANDTIARTASARLARAFSGALAPVRQMILDSTGPEDLIARIQKSYEGWRPEAITEIILEALSAQAANGAVRDEPTITSDGDAIVPAS